MLRTGDPRNRRIPTRTTNGSGATEQVAGTTDSRDHGDDSAELTVVMFPDSTGSNPYQRKLQSGVESHGATVELSDYGRYSSLLSDVLGGGRPDVVHLHWLSKCFVTDQSWLTAVLGLRLLIELSILRLFGVRTVWTVHNQFEHEERSPGVEFAVKLVAIRLIPGLIVHCRSAREIVVDAFSLGKRQRRKLTVVPHGSYRGSYPDDIGRGDARDRLGYTDGETVFCYFGQIRSYKNVPGLIETFGGLEDPNSRLLVVGNPQDESLGSVVESRARADDRVETVLRFVSAEVVQLYMNAADVVVLPYDSILTSGSAVLAMSFGRPVIAPDVGCVGELLDGGGGISYDPDDPDGLSAAIRTALEADLRSMSERSRRIATELDSADIGGQTLTVYRGDSSSTGQCTER